MIHEEIKISHKCTTYDIKIGYIAASKRTQIPSDSQPSWLYYGKVVHYCPGCGVHLETEYGKFKELWRDR